MELQHIHPTGGKKKKKTVELVVLMDLQPFLQKTAKEKNKTVWCFFVYIYKAVYFRAKTFKEVVFNIASSIASCFTS